MLSFTHTHTHTYSQWPIDIRFHSTFLAFQVNDQDYDTNGQGKFFDNFVRTEAWFGGVAEDMLER